MLARSGIRGFLASVEAICLPLHFVFLEVTLDGTMGSEFNSSLHCRISALLPW